MSLQHLNQYYNEIDKLRRFSGSRNENVLRPAFETLLKAYCADKPILLVNEIDLKTPRGNTIRLDGTLKDSLRQDWGYWESKDEFDDLDEEIAKKIAQGYPTSNTLFEDSQTAILYRDGREFMRVDMLDAPRLHALLTAFVSYEPPHVKSFREAIDCFKADLPDLLTTLRALLDHEQSVPFLQARAKFLKTCQEAINPTISLADIREMIIQHLLTEDIFTTIFEEATFHEDNNIARQIRQVTGTFFTGATRQNILRKIKPYYQAIKAQASTIADHHEKQRFLKVLYENFYKAYNPKSADTLGIVYTPHEIVHFMLEATDYLLEKHFGKLLGDKNVEILDPATGTGTFIAELLEYLPPHQLKYKYQHEIHANEVAILPYYIANLNIEATYAQKMNEYVPFENLCLVDTLDNLEFGAGKPQYGLFDLSLINLARIQQQNERKISVIIGNPPYNANQQNENDNNKNRPYRGIDEHIKQTYIKHSTAQKTKLYDMFVRFYRWATDRLKENEGIIAFITNRSFIDKRTFDGFRKVVGQEFSHIYLVDFGGDVRQNPKLSGTKHNIFGIQTGVAICFLVKPALKNQTGIPARILYTRRPELETATEKLNFLATTRLAELPFAHIQPDEDHNWLNLSENSWVDLLPVATKQTKYAKSSVGIDAIFELFSLGVVTARDEWVYDFSGNNLKEKVLFFINSYNQEVQRLQGQVTTETIGNLLDYTIKWTRAVKNDLLEGKTYQYQDNLIVETLYRPFVKMNLYFGRELNEMQQQMPKIFRGDNVVMAVNVGNKPFNVLASKYLVDLHFNGDSQCLPLYRYDSEGQRHDNITDFALARFRAHYQTAQTSEVLKTSEVLEISKLDIFHYVYAVLHDPAYRAKYELNLKRELPRIPFYDDFWQWATWGARLMDLHVNFEGVGQASCLSRVDRQMDRQDACPTPKLRADKTAHTIEIDSMTSLTDVPVLAWEYRLGNRSALEWVLDRYKEKRPSDPTIAEKFNTYRLADYKEQVIDLLARICTVSVETMRIVGEMAKILKSE